MTGTESVDVKPQPTSIDLPLSPLVRVGARELFVNGRALPMSPSARVEIEAVAR